MSRSAALARLIEAAALARPTEAPIFDAIAEVAAEELPEVAREAAVKASLLRESERRQMTLFQILEQVA